MDQLGTESGTGTQSEISDATKLRDDLDGLVVNMELTLISIIQGVALFFLTDSSRTPLLAGQFTVVPYVIVGLLIIFLFWSRSAIHTFTVIRWPLEFGHNFGYVACTLVEAILFTQMTNVANWYAVGAVFSAMIWFLLAFDLRMIRRRLRETIGPASTALFSAVEKEQLIQVRLGMPAVTGFYLIVSVIAWTQTGWFVNQGGNLIFAAMQLVAAVLYLGYVLRFFRRVAALVLAYREERDELLA